MAATGIIDGVKAVKPLTVKRTDITDSPTGDPNPDPATAPPAPGTDSTLQVDPPPDPPGERVNTDLGVQLPKPNPSIPSTTQPTPAPDPVVTAPSAPSGPVGVAPAPVTAPPPAASGPAWTPTAGIVDQVRGATTQDVTGSGYTPTTTPAAQTATATGATASGYTAEKAPDPVGYTAEGYAPTTSSENLSQAVTRITGADSELMQRQQAIADQQSNARGILNSTMGVEAGRAAVLDKATQIGAGDVQNAQFNAQTMNAASAFLAEAKNASAQFLAAAKNQNGMFNAEQANQASAFTANAKNTAANLLAAAQNTASMFNAGEGNKLAMFAVDQVNQASKFAAEMDNAAKQFNANAFNQAQQRYTDAMNAALAAQNDAINLSKRDTAQINASAAENAARVQGQLGSAAISAGATVQAAQLASADRAAALKEQAKEFGVTMDERSLEFTSNLSATQFNQYQQGLSAGLTSQLEPDAKQNWLHNYNSVWAATGSLPFEIDMSKFPPAGAPVP